MQTVRCYDDFGQPVDVPEDKLGFDTAVYGILILHNHVLLQKHPRTRLWQPLGDRLRKGETPNQLLKNICIQLFDAPFKVGALLAVEDRFVVDRRRSGLQLATLYYSLDRTTGMLPNFLLPLPNNTFSWEPLHGLTRQQMQFGYTAVQTAQNRSSHHKKL